MFDAETLLEYSRLVQHHVLGSVRVGRRSQEHRSDIDLRSHRVDRRAITIHLCPTATPLTLVLVLIVLEYKLCAAITETTVFDFRSLSVVLLNQSINQSKT